MVTHVEYDVIQGQMEKPGETMKDELHIWQSLSSETGRFPGRPWCSLYKAWSVLSLFSEHHLFVTSSSLCAHYYWNHHTSIELR